MESQGDEPMDQEVLIQRASDAVEDMKRICDRLLNDDKREATRDRRTSAIQHQKAEEKAAREFERPPIESTHSFRIGLQRARSNKGWSQKQLGSMTGYRENDIKAWEKGDSKPNQRQLNKLNLVLGSTLKF